MSMTEVAGSLLNMYVKHKKYLEDQVERHEYLSNKFKNRNDASYEFKAQAYENALDNLKSLFGDDN